MMVRSTPIRGIDITALPFLLAVQVAMARASSTWFSHFLAPARLSLKVSRISFRLLPSDCGNGPISKLSTEASWQMALGIDATCSASCPREYDLECGFHDSLPSGTRSKTRLVAWDSCSSSAMIGSMMRMGTSEAVVNLKKSGFRFPVSGFRILSEPTPGFRFHASDAELALSDAGKRTPATVHFDSSFPSCSKHPPHPCWC